MRLKTAAVLLLFRQWIVSYVGCQLCLFLSFSLSPSLSLVADSNVVATGPGGDYQEIEIMEYGGSIQ
jgi:hypothetical protein